MRRTIERYGTRLSALCMGHDSKSFSYRRAQVLEERAALTMIAFLEGVFQSLLRILKIPHELFR